MVENSNENLAWRGRSALHFGAKMERKDPPNKIAAVRLELYRGDRELRKNVD